MQNSSANKMLRRSKIDGRREVAKKISTKQKSFALKKAVLYFRGYSKKPRTFF